jgi:poly(hydroxyalkanoate) depolymerase family esterase
MKNTNLLTSSQLANEASFMHRRAKAIARFFRGGAAKAEPVVGDTLGLVDTHSERALHVGRLFKLAHISTERVKAKQKPAAKTNAQWLSKSFRNADGQRDYRVYIPSTYHGQALPLVIMLHGANQDAEDFSAGTQMNSVAEVEQYIVAYPEQPISASLMKCWNWFKPLDQLRGSGEPSMIAGITHEVIKTYNVDSDRVYIAGLSAGGAMAVVLAETYPELYAAAGIHSGLAYGVADNPFSALAAMTDGLRKTRERPVVDGITPLPPVPLIVFHGDKDRIVHPSNSDALMTVNAPSADRHGEAADEAGWLVATDSGQVHDGHSYTRTVFRDSTGKTLGEQWLVHELGHAWSGGNSAGAYTDGRGPDASRQMIRFFAAFKIGDIERAASHPLVGPPPYCGPPELIGPPSVARQQSRGLLYRSLAWQEITKLSKALVGYWRRVVLYAHKPAQ